MKGPGDFGPEMSKVISPRYDNVVNVHPTKDIKGLFRDHMEFDPMTEDIMTVWGIVFRDGG